MERFGIRKLRVLEQAFRVRALLYRWLADGAVSSMSVHTGVGYA